MESLEFECPSQGLWGTIYVNGGSAGKSCNVTFTSTYDKTPQHIPISHIITYVGKEDYYCSSYLFGKSQGYLETWQDDFRIYIGVIYITNSMGVYPIEVYPMIYVHALGDRRYYPFQQPGGHGSYSIYLGGSWGIYPANRKQ